MRGVDMRVPFHLTKLPVGLLIEESPFLSLIWREQDFILKFRDITQAIRCDEFEERPYDIAKRKAIDTLYHIRRIAYFTQEACDDPISLRFNGNRHSYTVWDGFHRLSAAIFLRQRTINVSVDRYETSSILELIAKRDPRMWKRCIGDLKTIIRESHR